MKFMTGNWGNTGKFQVTVGVNINMKDGASTLLSVKNVRGQKRGPPKYPQPNRRKESKIEGAMEGAEVRNILMTNSTVIKKTQKRIVEDHFMRKMKRRINLKMILTRALNYTIITWWDSTTKTRKTLFGTPQSNLMGNLFSIEPFS